LNHGKNWICGDKITTADFQTAALIFSHIYNDAIAGGPVFTDKGKAIVAEHANFAAYVVRLQEELKEYLASRPSADF